MLTQFSNLLKGEYSKIYYKGVGQLATFHIFHFWWDFVADLEFDLHIELLGVTQIILSTHFDKGSGPSHGPKPLFT